MVPDPNRPAGRTVTEALSGISSFQDLERLYIRSVLAETGGNRLKAAQRMGVHKATLFRKLKQLDISDA